jgi:hypothetical protein
MPEETWKEWHNKRKLKQEKQYLRPRKKQRYTGSQREKRGASVKYGVEEKYGDKEERKEVNLRHPFITITDRAINRAIVLPSGLTRSQAWAIVSKAWLGFRISKSKHNIDDMIKWAHVIRRTQDDLGIKLTEFTDPIVLDGPTLSQEEREYLQDGT